MLDSVSLSKMLGRPVDELLVSIAKYEIQGVSIADIADIFASTEDEIREAIAAPDYEDVKRLIAMEIAKIHADTDVSWDSLEHKSLQRLAKTVDMSSDPEFHLKVAALANKAVRRNRRTNEALNPALAGNRVQLTLTQRIVTKLTGGGAAIEERRIDLSQAERLRVPIQVAKQFLEPPKQSFDQLLEEAMEGVTA